MSKRNEPEHGSMVIYRHEKMNQERNRTAVVIGPVLPEPVSGDLWIGVQLPNHRGKDPVDLIDIESIIEIQPPAKGEPDTAA